MYLRWKTGVTVVAVAAGVMVAAAAPAHLHGRPTAAGPRAGAEPSAGTVVVPRAAPAPPPGPVTVAALRATVVRLADTGHNVTMKTVDTLTRGSVDTAHGLTAVAITQGGTSEFDEMVVDGTVYLRMNIDPFTNKQLGVDPGRWMRLERHRLPVRNALPVPPDAADPVDMPGIFTGVTAVRRVDPTNFVGTLDLTRVGGRNLPDPIEVAGAGKAATRVPFTLTTDGQGRIVQFSVDAAGFDPTLSLDVNYTNYGTQDTVTPPPSAARAPADVYTLFTP